MKQLFNLKNMNSRTVTLLVTIFAMVALLPACKKSGTGPNTPPGGADKMYPATQEFYNNIPYPEKSEFRYDGDHNLTYMGNKDRFVNINSGSTELIVINRDTMISTYAYDRNIYTEQGVVNAKNMVRWRYAGGLPPYQSAVSEYSFVPITSAKDQIGIANLGKISQFFTYDGNGNITSSKFVTNSWGSPNSSQYDPGGLETARLTFKGYDDKPSPYSSIAGYRFISFLWAYPHQFYFALCKNNPTQIIQESLDTNTMRFIITAQVDFTYVYNEQGYPTEVNIKTSNPSEVNQTFYQNFKFTYTK